VPWVTADGRRAAVTGTTAEPAGAAPNTGAGCYAWVVSAVGAAAAWEMPGKPASAGASTPLEVE
jgi:hypothetical protein